MSQPGEVNNVLSQDDDHTYFIMTPHLVWALSRDPYDFTLWNVVKMVAWDKGQCLLSTRDLATLAMMSMGKVKDCRDYLLSTGLLEGEVRRDHDYPQPVYHLRVPNLWPRNLELIEAKLGNGIKARLQFKAAQKRPAKKGKKSELHLVNKVLYLVNKVWHLVNKVWHLVKQTRVF
jgi:hypothetical protein